MNSDSTIFNVLNTLIEKVELNQPYFLTQSVADEFAPTTEATELIQKKLYQDK